MSGIKTGLSYKGEDIKIAFNGKFLLEILHALNYEELKIKLSIYSKKNLRKSLPAIRSEKVKSENL